MPFLETIWLRQLQKNTDKTRQKPKETKLEAGGKATDKASKEAVAHAAKQAAGVRGDGFVQIKVNRDERNTKIKELIKLASDQGYLTYDDINEALPESVLSAEEFDGILILLRGMDIEVIEDSDEQKFKAQMEKEERDPAGRADGRAGRSGPHVPQADGPGAPADPRAGSRDFQAHRGSGDQLPQALQPVRLRPAGVPRAWPSALEGGKERFDRIISDKHVDSREKYLKTLPG